MTTGQPTAIRHPIVPKPEPTIITSEMVDCATSAGSVSCLVLFVTSGQYYKTTIVDYGLIVQALGWVQTCYLIL